MWSTDNLPPRHRATLLAASLLGVLSLAGALHADSWQLPWPAQDVHVPLRELAEWRLPGVFDSVAIARGSLRNTQAHHVLSHHRCDFEAPGAGDNRAVRLVMTVRGWPDQAVWAAFGADNIETNGILDGVESRLMVGLDRGRWGLRGNAMDAPVWAPAQLPPDGGPCRIIVRMDPDGHLLHAKVEDAGGWRAPAELADVDPGWHTPPSDAATATAWELVRIETRGERAELLDLSLEHAGHSILMIK
ncbi:MAG: hypothetical protein ACOX5G_14220 [Kiritimatiellia bacterium]|jgi:hypothetical protein